MARTRLDSLLVERGIYPSRSRAAAAVMAGRVKLGHDGRRGQKPGQLVAVEEPIEVEDAAEYASRGGIKLANALDGLGIHPAGRQALDIGASTGGFTDCLLKRGAGRVIALDVGYGQLDWRLRGDDRVTVLDRANARTISPADLPFAPDLVTIDVSFISLTKILAAVLATTSDEFDCLAMVKPQFEVGRGRIGKGGVVREATHRRDAIACVIDYARDLGAEVMGLASSGLPGPAGNRETFIWLAERGRPGAVDDIQAELLRVEP